MLNNDYHAYVHMYNFHLAFSLKIVSEIIPYIIKVNLKYNI